MNTLVVGLLRGDEGKGKITDYLSDNYDVVVRYAGGPNAGHSIYRNEHLFVTHIIPSGIFNKKLCIIGRGCVVNLKKLYKEYLDLIEFLNYNHDTTFQNPEIEIKNLIKLSFSAHVITDEHIKQDTERENAGNGNGSTKQGISPAYRDKYYREGQRVIDVLTNSASSLTEQEYLFIKDIAFDDEQFINTNSHLNYLFEGAQGILLDIDSPYYPNVTSSSVGVGGILGGTGISYQTLMKDFNVVGIVKSYMSSVGVGKFLTELHDSTTNLPTICKYPGNDEQYVNPGMTLRIAGKEFGATTGRPRKVGWLDIPLINYAIRTTGVNSICLTRLDTLLHAFKDKNSKIPVCIAYRHKETRELITTADIYHLDQYEPVYTCVDIWDKCILEDNKFVQFIKFVEAKINIPIKYVSVGKNKNNIIEL
jgi:adenylosuccinate synthase